MLFSGKNYKNLTYIGATETLDSSVTLMEKWLHCNTRVNMQFSVSIQARKDVNMVILIT